jgi:hypothetical protein
MTSESFASLFVGVAVPYAGLVLLEAWASGFLVEFFRPPRGGWRAGSRPGLASAVRQSAEALAAQQAFVGRDQDELVYGGGCGEEAIGGIFVFH